MTDVLLVIGLSIATAALACRFAMGVGPARHGAFIPPPDAPALLFRNSLLQHGSPELVSRLVLQPGQSSLSEAMRQLAKQFPALPENIAATQEGAQTFTATCGAARLEVRWRAELCWILFHETGERPPETDDRPTMDSLQLYARTSPVPAWQVSRQNTITWHNSSYGLLLKKYQKRADEPLFPIPTGAGDQRVALEMPGQDALGWYALSAVQRGGATMCHATPCDELVAAEIAQRNFVQTLAKTFAHLSIGLAIFDRDGRLALFNPALLDLTHLPAQFLSGRPTALSFFDALRENRQMPEPKSYKSWRDNIADVIAAATDGSYREIWSLENGHTYSVIGRPHPDGATAFMIEDISAEVTLTRNFRSELELSQAVLDTFDIAIVVFSATGFVTFANTAYRQMWDHDPESAFVDVSLQDCIDIWSAKARTGPNWPGLEAHMTDYANRKTLRIPFQFDACSDYVLEVHSVTPDANMICFSKSTDRSGVPTGNHQKNRPFQTA